MKKSIWHFFKNKGQKPLSGSH